MLSLVLAAVIAAPVLADGEQAKKKKRAPKKFDPAAMVLRKLEKAELTEEQVAKIKKLYAGVADKIKAARDKANLTPEQKKARAEAMKKAKEEGKKGKEMMEAVRAAAELTPEQKAAMGEAQKANAEVMKQVFALLTPEQKEKSGIKIRGGRKPGAKKKAGAKKPRAKKKAEE